MVLFYIKKVRVFPKLILRKLIAAIDSNIALNIYQ